MLSKQIITNLKEHQYLIDGTLSCYLHIKVCLTLNKNSTVDENELLNCNKYVYMFSLLKLKLNMLVFVVFGAFTFFSEIC